MKIIYADTFLKRFLVLLCKKEFNEALLFTNLVDSSIHTLFMRFEIDVYFIEDDLTVFDKVSLKPWRFYKSSKSAKYILETKKNRLDYEIGDKVDLDFI